MTRRQENGFLLEERQGKIYLSLNLTVKRRALWVMIALLLGMLLLLGSSLNEDARKFVMDVLVSLLQLAWLTSHPQES